MTVLSDLTDAVRTALATVGPATVAIGRHGRGAGLVVAPNRVLTNAHNLRDRTTQVTFADGRADQGRLVGTDADHDVVVLDVDTGDIAPPAWADDETGDRRCRLHRRAEPLGRPRHAGLRVRTGPSVPWPARAAHQGRHRAHGAAGPRTVGQPARRRHRAASSASTPTVSATASTSPCRRTPSCGSRWTPWPRATTSGASASASRSCPVRPRRGCEPRSASPSSPGCSSPASCPARRPMPRA